MEKTIDDLLTRVCGTRTVFQLGKELEEGGGKPIVIEQRELQPEAAPPPVRAETQARAHTFYAVNGFCEYLKEYGSGNTVIYADFQGEKIYAILDETAKGGVEMVTLTPQKHPRWTPRLSKLNSVMDMSEFVDFIRDNRRTVIAPSGRELILSLSQIKASTEITLHQGSGKDSLNGLMIKSKIQGKDNTDIIDLPEIIQIKTPIFVDTPDEIIDLDVIIDASKDGTKVTVRFSSADIKEVVIRAFDRMMTVVSSLSDAIITYGVPTHSDWRYQQGSAG